MARPLNCRSHDYCGWPVLAFFSRAGTMLPRASGLGLTLAPSSGLRKVSRYRTSISSYFRQTRPWYAPLHGTQGWGTRLESGNNSSAVPETILIAVKRSRPWRSRPISASPTPGCDTLLTPGLATYGTLATLTSNGYGHHFDAKRVAVSLYDPTTWTFYTFDDPGTAFLKMLYVDLKVPGGLGGAYVWALKDDDANGTVVKTMALGLGK